MGFCVAYPPSYGVQTYTDSGVSANVWWHVFPPSKYQMSYFWVDPTLGHVQQQQAAQGFWFYGRSCHYQGPRQTSSIVCLTSFLQLFSSSFLSHGLQSILAVDSRDNCGLQMKSLAGPRNITPCSYLIAKEPLHWSSTVPLGRQAQ